MIHCFNLVTLICITSMLASTTFGERRCWPRGDCLDFYDSLSRVHVVNLTNSLTQNVDSAFESFNAIEDAVNVSRYVVDCERWYPTPVVDAKISFIDEPSLSFAFKASAAAAIANAAYRIENGLNMLLSVAIERINRLMRIPSGWYANSVDNSVDDDGFRKSCETNGCDRVVACNYRASSVVCVYDDGDCVDVAKLETIKSIREIKTAFSYALPYLRLKLDALGAKFNVTRRNLCRTRPGGDRRGVKYNNYDATCDEPGVVHQTYAKKIATAKFVASSLSSVVKVINAELGREIQFLRRIAEKAADDETVKNTVC